MGFTNSFDDSHTLQHTGTPPDTLLPPHTIRNDILWPLLLPGYPWEACTIVRVTARATGDSSNTDLTPFFPVGQSMAKGSPMGVVTGLDILNDPLAAIPFKSLTSRSQGSLMYEQASGGTTVALARIPKNVRCTRTPKRT